MTEEEIKKIWIKASDNQTITLDLPQLVMDLKGKLKENDRMLIFRDFREIFAAVLVMCFFGYKSTMESDTLSKVTSTLFVIWSGYVIYRLLAVRKYKKIVDLSQSLRSQLLEQKNYIEQQAHLLESIFSWYLGPFAIIATISKVGDLFTGPFHWIQLFSFSVVLAILYLFCWGVYVLNKKAAQTAFRPIIENIDRVLLQIDSET